MRLPAATLRLAVVALVASAAACAPSSEEDVEDGSGALIGGREVEAGELASVVYLQRGCTGVKIAERKILTAAHCVFDPSTLRELYGPSRPLSYARGPRDEGRQLAVAAVHVHPSWRESCEVAYCAIAASTMLLDASDVAVVELDEDAADVPSTPVALDRLEDGADVTLLGFGCVDGVHWAPFDGGRPPQLRKASSVVIPVSAAVHQGSPITEELSPQVDRRYALTAGPGSRGGAGGLCPGDSGGPLLRTSGDDLVVVGVNANYTFAEDDEVGMPVTNWHTRLDHPDVVAWLRPLLTSASSAD